jgi:hypothetical protein
VALLSLLLLRSPWKIDWRSALSEFSGDEQPDEEQCAEQSKSENK